MKVKIVLILLTLCARPTQIFSSIPNTKKDIIRYITDEQSFGSAAAFIVEYLYPEKKTIVNKYYDKYQDNSKRLARKIYSIFAVDKKKFQNKILKKLDLNINSTMQNIENAKDAFNLWDSAQKEIEREEIWLKKENDRKGGSIKDSDITKNSKELSDMRLSGTSISQEDLSAQLRYLDKSIAPSPQDKNEAYTLLEKDAEEPSEEIFKTFLLKYFPDKVSTETEKVKKHKKPYAKNVRYENDDDDVTYSKEKFFLPSLSEKQLSGIIYDKLDIPNDQNIYQGISSHIKKTNSKKRKCEQGTHVAKKKHCGPERKPSTRPNINKNKK